MLMNRSAKKNNRRVLPVYSLAALLVLATMSTDVWAVNDTDTADAYRAYLLRDNRLTPCRTNASCAALGVSRLEAGNTVEASQAVDLELDLAELDAMAAESEKRQASGTARAIMALIHEGDVAAKTDPAVARAWYRFALERAGRSGPQPMIDRVRLVATARLDAINDKDVMKGVPASGATFERYIFMGVNNTITLRPVSGKPDVFRLTGEFGYPEIQSDGPASVNTGNIAGLVRFFDGKADIVVDDTGKPVDGTRRLAPSAIESDRCVLHLEYDGKETLTVTTLGNASDCGFGFNVVADGAFHMTSRSAP